MSVKSTLVTSAGVAALLAATGLRSAGLAATAPAQPASAAVTAAPVNWQAEAYSALIRFEHGGGQTALDHLVTFGFHLPRQTRADIDQLAADANGAGTFPVSDDEQYVTQDLTGSGL